MTKKNERRPPGENRRPRDQQPGAELPELELLPEPMLEFQYGQLSEDPHDGLSLFGPFDAGKPAQPKGLSYAVIGCPEGIAAQRELALLIQRGIQVNSSDVPSNANDIEREEARDEIASRLRLWPAFPSFEAAFRSNLPVAPVRIYPIDRARLLAAAEIPNPYTRVGDCVEPYLDALRNLKEREDVCNLAFCVVPEEVNKNCRAKSEVGGTAGSRTAQQELRDVNRGQSNLFITAKDREKYDYAVDFRRQLKARCMQYGIPIQIVRESTLRPNDEEKPGVRRLTPLSDRAWNLTTTAYYKAGGKPWRLHGVREGVCYIGIAFKLLPKGDSDRSACSAAQMFLDTGDGVVFRGTDGRWYSPERKQFHLSFDAARDLLKGVLATYDELDGKPLREVFVHSRSRMDPEEIQGLTEACPKEAKLVIVNIRQERRGMRLYREGSYPVIRGTFMKRTARSCYLWTSGFKPQTGTYDGWETPAPLSIRVQHGEADIREIAKDVLGLTKLNYNTCKLGESEPVTIKFSDVVGEILVSNPGVKKPEAKFKFYI